MKAYLDDLTMGSNTFEDIMNLLTKLLNLCQKFDLSCIARKIQKSRRLENKDHVSTISGDEGSPWRLNESDFDDLPKAGKDNGDADGLYRFQVFHIFSTYDEMKTS